jgi:[ribosomal protein S18]-alanine N-acetyltransferase
VGAPCATTLRPARPAEAPTLAQMSRELIEAGLGWRYTPRRMAALIADPETVTLVACAAQRIQGFAVMQFGEAEAHLILLCVRSSQRKRGIGRGLHQWLLESARVAGIASVQLELRADNAAAMSFYRRLGYAETQWLPDYYGDRIAARRMRLKLGAAEP